MVGNEIDYHELQKDVYSAAKKAFELVRKEHADENFYAFGLSTDSDAVTLIPISQSEQAFQQLAEDYGESDLPLWLRWSPDEWLYWDVGAEYFNAVKQIVGAALYEDEGDEDFAERKRKFLDTFADALRKLDSEGFFGHGEERDKVTLLLHISDPSEYEEMLMLDYVRNLNPAAAYHSYEQMFSGGV